MSKGYVAKLQQKLADLAKERDYVYFERNNLVSLLSTIYPSCLGVDTSQKDKQWQNVVYIETPEGQMSWHFEVKLLPMFSHLVFKEGELWDGHTTEEKYERLARLIKTNKNG